MTESAEYTPTLEDMRAVWVSHRAFNNFGKSFGKFWEAKANAEFNRWLETVRAEAKAEALEEAAAKLEDASVSPILCWDKCGDPKCRDDIRVGAATEIQSWLRARANQYKENQ